MPVVHEIGEAHVSDDLGFRHGVDAAAAKCRPAGNARLALVLGITIDDACRAHSAGYGHRREYRLIPFRRKCDQVNGSLRKRSTTLDHVQQRRCTQSL